MERVAENLKHRSQICSAHHSTAKEEINTGDIILKKMRRLMVYRWEVMEQVNMYPKNDKRPVKRNTGKIIWYIIRTF